jgi:pilus assembly protein CpaF
MCITTSQAQGIKRLHRNELAAGRKSPDSVKSVQRLLDILTFAGEDEFIWPFGRLLPRTFLSEQKMSRQQIFEASVEYFLAPIGPFLDDDGVTEIMVNGHEQIYIERRGRLHKTAARFESEDALLSAVHNVAQWVGREVTTEQPVLDARLPNGSRVHAVIPPSARLGTCLTIRKFGRQRLSLDDLIELNSLSLAAREFLELCVRLKKNILIAGGTGTGKTVLLGAISAAIPEEERIIVIEDTNELRLHQEHSLYLEVQHPDQYGRGGLSIRQLFVASLRMRPDRIVVGEVRSGEALDLVQSMISGHAGSLSTIHANTALDALLRLETLSLMSDVEIPVYVARAQVASAIDVVVQITRFTEDGSRKITRITEACGLDEQNRYTLRDLFVSRLHGRTREGMLIADLKHTGERPTFARAIYEQGLGERVQLTRDLWLK